VVHHRQSLPLGLEPGDYLTGIHAGLDNFERHPAANRPFLLSLKHDAKATFADLLEEFVGADNGARLFADRRLVIGRCIAWQEGLVQKTACMIVPPKQSLDALTKTRVAGASPFKKGRSLRRVLLFQCFGEDSLLLHPSTPAPLEGGV
jgi:hypothetical protein